MSCRLPGLLDLGLQWQARGFTRVAPPRVLLCGDADFSYAAALVSELGAAAEVTATAFEEEPDLLLRYPYAAETMERLRAADARLGFGIDARTLREHYPTQTWDRVVFNLPQAPPQAKARNQIQRHRALLRDFCESAAGVLEPHGQIWVTLLAGQGGTPLDSVQRVPGDSWQVQLAAAQSDLLVVAVLEAEMEELAAGGYMPGGRGIRRVSKIGAMRKAQGLVAHVLVKEGDLLDEPVAVAAAACRASGKAATARSEVSGEGGDGAGVVSALGVSPLAWKFDNSFWDAERPLSEDELERLCRDSLGEEADVMSASPELLDVYQNAEGRGSRTYRFFYGSSRLALSRDRALSMNRQVCEAVAASGAGLPRTPSAEALAAGDLSDGESGKAQRSGGAAMSMAAEAEALSMAAEAAARGDEDRARRRSFQR